MLYYRKWPCSDQLFLFFFPTGGADRTVCLWEVESGLCVQEYRGHADVVRDVKVMTPELFISASNDW